MQETETKIKKTILGDIKVASHRNEKYNRYGISRQQKKERTQKNSTIGSKNPKTRFYGGSESNDFRVACGVAQTNIGKTLEILNIELGSLYERHAKAFFF